MLVKLDDRQVLVLFYSPRINRFIDEFGNVIHDIHRLVTPSQIMIFKQYKNKYLIPDVTNKFLVELIYPDSNTIYY